MINNMSSGACDVVVITISQAHWVLASTHVQKQSTGRFSFFFSMKMIYTNKGKTQKIKNLQSPAAKST